MPAIGQQPNPTGAIRISVLPNGRQPPAESELFLESDSAMKDPFLL
jgi:hypothetical protein